MRIRNEGNNSFPVFLALLSYLHPKLHTENVEERNLKAKHLLENEEFFCIISLLDVRSISYSQVTHRNYLEQPKNQSIIFQPRFAFAFGYSRMLNVSKRYLVF